MALKLIFVWNSCFFSQIPFLPEKGQPCLTCSPQLVPPLPPSYSTKSDLPSMPEEGEAGYSNAEVGKTSPPVSHLNLTWHNLITT